MPTDIEKFTTIMVGIATAKSLKELQNLIAESESKSKVGATEAIDRLIKVFKHSREYRDLLIIANQKKIELTA